MMQDAYKRYKQAGISTATQEELLLMLYDGAIKFLKVAISNIGDFRNYKVVSENIGKAQDILTELILALDFEKGGDIAKNLMGIYIYLKKRLVEANINKEKEPIEEVIKILEELREAWAVAIEKTNSLDRKRKVSGINIQG
jgi:flagellar protein FliS